MAAVQGLYSWDMRSDKNSADIAAFDWLEKKPDDEDLTFARFLLSGTLENIEQIDSLIKAHLSPKWEFSRINKVTLADLRVSIYAILYQKETEVPVIINEAIEIAKSFGEDNQAAFINGILDKIAKENR